MSAKKSSGEHAPSWTEITLGAILSVALGIVVGAALLVLRPVTLVKDMPKEADRAPGVIYYVEGWRNTAKAKEAVAKRKLFTQGKSVSVTEEEINSFFAAPPPPAAAPKPKAGEKAKPGDKAAPAPAAAPAPGEMVSAGPPNFRIREGAMQLAVPMTLSLFGLFQQQVVVLARGGFAKDGDVFAFNPETFYVGSCPVQRLPFVGAYVKKKIFALVPVPDDIAAAWPKLTNATVDGLALKLTMP